MKGQPYQFLKIGCALLAGFILHSCASLTGSDQIRLNKLMLKTVNTDSGQENLCLEMEFNRDPTCYLQSTNITFVCENCVQFGGMNTRGIAYEMNDITRPLCPGCYLIRCKAETVYIGNSSNEHELHPRIRKNSYTLLIPWKEHFGNYQYLYLWCPKIEFREKYKKGDILEFSRKPSMGL